MNINSVRISKDGNLLVTGGKDGYVTVWDYHEAIIVKRYKNKTGCIGLAISNDGKYVASSCGFKNEAIIRVWELKNDKFLFDISGNEMEDQIEAIEFTSDGRQLIAGGRKWEGIQSNNIRVWDIDSRRCIRKYSFDGFLVKAMRATSDGKKIIAGDAFSSPIRVWDVMSQRECMRLCGHDLKNGSERCMITPDDKMLLSVSLDGTARLYSLDNGHQLSAIRFSSGLTSCAITRDASFGVIGSGSKKFATDIERKASADKCVRVVDLKTRSVIGIKKFEAIPWDLALAPDEKSFVVVGDGYIEQVAMPTK
ncbi:MAG: hypothetical protein JNJ77_21510 [Planctomycetia bacterium]|nr:hypothetical protein [Planctomycetia bacterium]